ncbi:uncharacterized protein LOC106011597 [Aplysia californica]|uniref:Uncharacterized protein LOC106011597 n=1 Tax=Aplysia californica TaxID=6500 RepID=A0ABM0ZYM3_APLCA|nr:uncharacterized protein LOC106011597 [Aplysia californica]
MEPITLFHPQYEHIIDPLKDAFGGLGSLTSISTLTRLFEDFQTLSKLDSIAQNLVQSIQDLSWDSLPSPGVKDTSIKSSLGGVLCGRGKSAFNIQELEQKFSYQQKVQDSRGSFDPRFENVKEKIEKKRLGKGEAGFFLVLSLIFFFCYTAFNPHFKIIFFSSYFLWKWIKHLRLEKEFEDSAN